jgi:hypothetical protein
MSGQEVSKNIQNISLLFESIVSINRGKALDAAVAASSLNTTALRLPALYSEYQEQLGILLTKLTGKSGYKTSQIEQMLDREDLADIKPHILYIEDKLAHLAEGVKANGRSNTILLQQHQRRQGSPGGCHSYFLVSKPARRRWKKCDRTLTM